MGKGIKIPIHYQPFFFLVQFCECGIDQQPVGDFVLGAHYRQIGFGNLTVVIAGKRYCRLRCTHSLGNLLGRNAERFVAEHEAEREFILHVPCEYALRPGFGRENHRISLRPQETDGAGRVRHRAAAHHPVRPHRGFGQLRVRRRRGVAAGDDFGAERLRDAEYVAGIVRTAQPVENQADFHSRKILYPGRVRENAPKNRICGRPAC